MPLLKSATPFAPATGNKSRSESTISPITNPNAFNLSANTGIAATSPAKVAQQTFLSPVSALSTSSNSSSIHRHSSYQRSLNILKDLYSIPEVADYIIWPQIDPRNSWQIDVTDPSRILMDTLKLATPLCALYNSLRPREKMELPSLSYNSTPSGFQTFLSASTGSLFEDGDVTRRKKAVLDFLKACKQELQIPESQLFQIGDLFREELTEKQQLKVRFRYEIRML